MRNTFRINFWAFVVILFICTALSGEAFAQVFNVAANNHSVSKPSFPGAGLNTNIKVTTQGQLLVITASRSDTWSIDSSDPMFSSNANGVVGDVPPPLTLGKFTFPHGALIGSLDMGKPFLQSVPKWK